MRAWILVLGMAVSGWSWYGQNEFIIGTLWGPDLVHDFDTDTASYGKMTRAHVNLAVGMTYKRSQAYNATTLSNPINNKYFLSLASSINNGKPAPILKILVEDTALYRLRSADPACALSGDFCYPNHPQNYTITGLNSGQLQALAGYSVLPDEPSMSVLADPMLSKLYPHLHAADTNRVLFTALGSSYKAELSGSHSFATCWLRFDTGYVAKFINNSNTNVVAFDYYVLAQNIPFTGSSDPADSWVASSHFMSSPPGSIVGPIHADWIGGQHEGTYFRTLDLFATRTREAGKIFWGIPNATENLIFSPTRASYRNPTEPVLRFNAFSNIIYGAKGLMWYNYGSNPQGCYDYTYPYYGSNCSEHYIKSPDNDGTLYTRFQQVNSEVKKLGAILINLDWLGTFHDDGVGGTFQDGFFQENNLPLVTSSSPVLTPDVSMDWRIAIGTFSDRTNLRRRFAAVLNKDVSSSRTADFSVRGCPRVTRVDKATGDTVALSSPASSTCQAGYTEISIPLNAGDMQLIALNYGGRHGAIIDYDGDGMSDLGVKFDGYYGNWYWDLAANGYVADGYPTASPDGTALSYGEGIAVPGDYDGDGRTDRALKDDNGEWRIDFAANGFDLWDTVYAGWGDATYRPVPADYDGDGKTDLAVVNFEGSIGGWAIDTSSNGFRTDLDIPENADFWGPDVCYPTTCHAVPADYNGDGRADRGLKLDWSGGFWWVDTTALTADWSFYRSGWGDTSYVPAPADFDGDGKADFAVMYKDGYSTWYIDYAANGFVSGGSDPSSNAEDYLTPFGTIPMKPVPADYDGDGKADLAGKSDYYGSWHIDYSGNGLGSQDAYFDGWGDSTLKPLKKPVARNAVQFQNSLGFVSFAFDLDRALKGSVTAYGLDGKKVASLFEGGLQEGPNRLTWTRADLSGKGMKRGVYLLRLQAGPFQSTQRLVLTD